MVVPFTSRATCASIRGGEVHHVVVVGVGHVELEHGELGIVLRRDAFVAEIAVDLVHAVHAADDQPLQVKLRRDAQVQIGVERVVVGDERLGHRAAGDGMHHRRLDFDEAVAVEETPHRLHDLRAFDEHLAHIGIHRQINVTAAIASFDILQSVPLLGQWEQVFYQEGDLFHVDRKFIRTGAKEVALHSDVVTDVEQFVELKTLLADVVEPDVDLQPPSTLLKMGKTRFPLHANGHDPSRDADVDA